MRVTAWCSESLRRRCATSAANPQQWQQSPRFQLSLMNGVGDDNKDDDDDEDVDVEISLLSSS